MICGGNSNLAKQLFPLKEENPDRHSGNSKPKKMFPKKIHLFRPLKSSYTHTRKICTVNIPNW